MSSFQPFVDLPQIKVFSDSYASDPDSLSVYSLDIDPSRLDSAEDNSERTRPADCPTTSSRTTEMQRRLSKMENSAAGHIYSPTGDRDGTSYPYYLALGPMTFPDQHEYTGHNVRYMSPSGPWGGDRSVTEIDSASSEGCRSPRSAWNYNSPYMQPESSPESLTFSFGDQIHQQVMEPADHRFPTGDESLYAVHSVTPIVLQHYPDPELELAPYGSHFPKCSSGYRGEADEEEGIPPSLDMNQEHGEDEECGPPSKRMKLTPPTNSPTAQSLSPPIPRAKTINGNCTPSRPRGCKINGSMSKQGHKNAARLFICSFSHYGCQSTFRSKNEWKRHFTSQHLKLGFFRCDVGYCNASKETKRSWGSDTSGRRITVQPSYHDFNRKDLFTQHQRRMHKPQALIENPSERQNNAFEASLEKVRQRCWIENRQPPNKSRCGFCGDVFQGPKSWEERMEHVGKHFELGDQGEREDEYLREWALGEGMVRPEQGGWVLAGRG